MKNTIKTILVMLMLIPGMTTQAQDHDSRLEVGASLKFWTPSSLHFKSSDEVTQYHFPDGSYLSEGGLTGYGLSLAPGLQLHYYFKPGIGVSAGLYMVHMDKELTVRQTDTTFASYENIADIPNITLGICGRIINTGAVQLVYETGLDFVSGYGLEKQFSTQSADPPDMNADGLALGVYARAGADLRVYRSLYLTAAMLYSYIPAEIEYRNTEGSEKTNLDTTLGGVALETGLAWHF